METIPQPTTTTTTNDNAKKKNSPKQPKLEPKRGVQFLRPYVCILGLVGLRPNAVDVDLCTLLGHLQSIMVLTLLLAGYVLQYLSGFR